MKRANLVVLLVCAVIATPSLALAQEAGEDDSRFGSGGAGYSSGGGDDVQAEGDSDGNDISSEVTFSNSVGDSEPPETVVPITDWEPPACWFEPRTSSEAEDYVTAQLQSWVNIPTIATASTRDRLLNHFENGEPYEEYNREIEDEGRFWFGVTNPDRVGDPEARACYQRPSAMG
jgi:hypothetical protein